MSEEEKEVIADLKEILKEWQKIVDIEDLEERDIEMSMYIEEMPFYQIKTLLNLVEKQQKEIEVFKRYTVDCRELEIETNNAWEDKIKERLKKLKEKEQELSDEQGYWGGSELQARIEELEELLEECL